MGIRPDARTLYAPRHTADHRRDMAARHAVHSNELLRQAYKYIARNTTLPARTRHMAQLELNAFPNRARPTVVKERCTDTGRGRGILTDFGLCRVRVSTTDNPVPVPPEGACGTDPRRGKGVVVSLCDTQACSTALVCEIALCL